MRRPRALVAYETLFGDTENVARSVAQGFAIDFDVSIVDVADSHDVLCTDYDLVVIGAPTHRAMLSTPVTRANAHGLGARFGSVETGMREWLEAQPRALEAHPTCACFDTRTTGKFPAPAEGAHELIELLQMLGLDVVSRQSFYVAGIAGPVCVGELNRARFWADHLAARSLARAGSGDLSRR